MSIERLLKVSLLLLILFLSLPLHAAFYGRQLCQQTGFSCWKVKGNQSWRSLFPNAHDRGIVMRVNRMNTYLYPGLTIAVPDNLENSDIMDFSPSPLTVAAPQEKVLIFDPI